MSPSNTLPRTVLCAVAFLACAGAHAVEAPRYFGHAAAVNDNPFEPQQDIKEATTGAPAAYAVGVDGNIATSFTDAANGGSASVYSRSAGAYSDELGFVYGGGAGADASIYYHAMLLGPADGPIVVPVRVLAHGMVGGGGSTQASVSFVVNFDMGGADGQMLAGATLGGATGDSFTFDQVAAFKVNAPFEVYLEASSGSGGPGIDAGWSQGFVDPVFTIDDPLLASLYHFEGIPGLAASVPEPASGALALLGLAAVFAARRPRSRSRA